MPTPTSPPFPFVGGWWGWYQNLKSGTSPGQPGPFPALFVRPVGLKVRNFFRNAQ